MSVIYIDEIRESFDGYFRERARRIVNNLVAMGHVVDLRRVDRSINHAAQIETAIAVTRVCRMHAASDCGAIYDGLISTGIQSVNVDDLETR